MIKDDSLPVIPKSRFIPKVGIYFIMFIPAAFIAGLYGAIHDQISYSFSSEYFTHFKFIQFSMPWAYESPRLGAAIVGALATWWMGILVYLILGLFSFRLPSPNIMAKEVFRSFLVVIIIALITGIAGLAYGYYAVNENSIGNYMRWVRPGVIDPIQFVRVGFMHNASYIGGLTGLVSGILYLFFAKRRY